MAVGAQHSSWQTSSAFANTLAGVRDEPPATDHLLVYDDLAAWAARAGALDASLACRLQARARREPAAAAAALRAAHALRDAVHATFTAVATGAPAPPAALVELRDAAANALAAADLRAGGLDWPAGELKRPLWPIAIGALDLLRDPGRLAQLKRCG